MPSHGLLREHEPPRIGEDLDWTRKIARLEPVVTVTHGGRPM
jgi:hypothetical protein